MTYANTPTKVKGADMPMHILTYNVNGCGPLRNSVVTVTYSRDRTAFVIHRPPLQRLLGDNGTCFHSTRLRQDLSIAVIHNMKDNPRVRNINPGLHQ